jgi:hypothetical protein
MKKLSSFWKLILGRRKFWAKIEFELNGIDLFGGFWRAGKEM